MNKLISLAKVLSKLNLLGESRSIIRLASGEDGFLSNKMRADLARIAQETYDEWEQDEEGWSDSFGEIGVGGICHIIADRIIGYLNGAGYGSNFSSCSVSDPYVQHVYVVAWIGHKNEDADPDEGFEEEEDSLVYDVYSIDIPYWTYEEGGGFTWRKIPDIKFGERDVEIRVIEYGVNRERLDEITDSY
jgi:hypothetical protein